MKHLGFILMLLVVFASCKNKKTPQAESVQSRTTGHTDILVDESFNNIIADQIEIFTSDYPDAHFTVIPGNENKILPTFLKDSVRVMVLSRMLTADEEKVYTKKSIPVYTSRFAIDGIALITSKENADSTITADEIISIMKGNSTGVKNLVFDNAYSSTIRYFKDLAQVKEIPKKGVYTLNTNKDVIKYVSENKGYIGVVGINWLIKRYSEPADHTENIKMLGVKNVKGKKGDDAYYKPVQENLISGVYPFLRNIYIINAEGKEGLGTGFANWLVSQRGQLIVLKSGLGPHKIVSRDFNLKN
ncbi:PstS family phosphate ABC transporter substrate-binding protein [Pedobacter nutrimenti]|jgi:phosphate transport system substrate-binding protein|uniref:Phosphate transport system substrate-binding protein n=1 Tax=Pedobacter nutrimenti TaxID=1241337 RepID=A0A318UJS7_9SPHI|nr:substrate-binding domain-containing protein [Pedobacter nutrimenti]PYF75567.1 phosphate transport system substrate-binding protein [Pedobacter nutrimenti]